MRTTRLVHQIITKTKEMVNILDLLKGQMGSAVMDKLADVIGDSGDNTSNAVGSMLPSILGGLMSKGATTEGASGILDFMTKEKVDGSMFDNLGGLLGNSGKLDGLMKLGGLALPFILGGKKAGFLNLLSRVTGMGSGKTSSLLSILAPMVIGMIGKQVKSGGLNASGLMNLLSGQKDHVSKALPAGMSDMLGFAGAAPQATEKAAASGGFLKWLIPLVLLAALGWFLSKGCNGDAKVEATEAPVENTTAPTTSTKAATTTNMDGDQSGKSTTATTAPVASTTEADKIAANTKTAVTETAPATTATTKASGRSIDEFKLAFAKLLAKKTEVSSSGYTLSKMTFDPKSQRLSYYSKAEFEGLAAALKAKADGKISIAVHTNDGGTEKENKRLSTMRANQIVTMLQTLGVKAKQLTFKGMGSKDGAKAANNAIDISVK